MKGFLISKDNSAFNVYSKSETLQSITDAFRVDTKKESLPSKGVDTKRGSLPSKDLRVDRKKGSLPSKDNSAFKVDRKRGSLLSKYDDDVFDDADTAELTLDSTEYNDLVTTRVSLLSLDADAYNLILIQYLNFIDMASLDIAYCSKVHRGKLFDVYSTICIKNLNMDYFNHAVDDVLVWIGSRKINVHNISSNRVHFSNQSTLTDDGLSGLSKHCPNLLSLEMDYRDNVSDTGITKLVHSCRKLQSLSIQGCDNISNVGMIELARYCSDMKALNIRGCASITTHGVRQIANHCKYLESFKANNRNNCDLNVCIKEIAFNCHNLKVLDIACGSITDDTLIKLAHNCPRLEVLDISHNLLVTTVGFTALVNLCRNLKVLKLNGLYFSDIDIIELSRCCSNLRSLSIGSSFRITDVGMVELFHNCNKIEELDISLTNITDIAIFEMCYFCKRIQSLIIKGCKRISDDSILLLAKHCNSLKSLDISFCNLDDKCFMEISRCCFSLEKLNCSGNKKITDVALISLAENCKDITELNISECSRISDDAIIAVAHHCKGLKCLMASYCNHLSDKSIVELALHCNQLASLDIKGSWITKYSIKVFASHANLIKLDAYDCRSLDISPSIVSAMFNSRSARKKKYYGTIFNHDNNPLRAEEWIKPK